MPRGSDARAVSAIVGVVILVASTLAMAGMLGAVALDMATTEPGPRVALTLSVEASSQRVALAHEGGDQLAMADVRIRVSVDGVPLSHQPPVPFFVARGFRAGPTGPFNVASDGVWTAGETASFSVASTNEPPIVPGATVRVRIYAGDQPVGEVTAGA